MINAMRIPISCVLAVCLLAAEQVQGSLPDFTSLVAESSPAVVNITATREAKVPSSQFNQEEVPEMFKRFFRDYQGKPAPRPATGSGFIISEDGYLLTNHHVVENASEIVVALSDRRERVASLVGADPVSDLALLKIDAENLPVVEIGQSKNLKVGEWVVAIGSPFGFELSVTAGIVSAKGRSLPDERGNYVPFIQTDVAINPGNSGGPLFNLEGEVVGINSQIFTRSGGFMGLSFAIPIDVAMEVVQQLKDKGTVSRGWLGVQIQKVDRDLAESFGLDRAAGALVTQVFADSPAERAGLKEGDIIVEFADQAVDLSSDLPHIVGRTKAESQVNVVVVRAGDKKVLAVTVGRLDPQGKNAPSILSGNNGLNRLGIRVRELTNDDAARMGIDRGVVIEEVSAGAGQNAGLQEGDVITTVDGRWVDSQAELNEILEGLANDVAIPVRILRNGQAQFVAIKIDQ
jgi:serine protease Do